MAKQDDSNFYIRASVGRGRETIIELEKHGGNNVFSYKGGGDKNMIYYIGRDGIIQFTTDDTEIGYIITHSGWTELKLKEPKKERMFVISVKEGNGNCKRCNLYGKCDDEQERKCEIASLLESDKPLDGKTFAMVEVDPEDIPFHVFENVKKT